MHDHRTPEQIQADAEALELARTKRYEVRDVDWNLIGKAINGFFIFTIVCVVISFFALWGVQRFLVGLDRKPYEPLVDVSKRVPAKSPLQNNVTAWKDMSDLRKKEQAALETYGTADAAKGTMRVPIDRAMEMLAEKGL